MTVRLLAVLALALALGAAAVARASRGHGGHEVWAVDQSNTNGTQSGGTLYVYDGRRLEDPERIDLGAETEDLCLERTGSAPVRPHMLLFSPRHSHAILSFVASGHVVFFDARERTPVACIDVGAQAHAAVPSPDGSYVIVADQNGKRVHRIATDYRAGSFTLEPAATIDLAAGTTPSGAPRQDPALRPDTAPICPIVESSSRLTFVTLRGGGLFVLDSRSTPLRIVAEYDRETIHGNGCGGIQTREKLYLDSGGGTAANMDEFDVYAFDLDDFRSASDRLVCVPPGPNLPAPKLVVSQDDRMHADAHGVALVGHHLWVADRVGNRVVSIDTRTDRVAGEFSLPGPLSDDPSPDLLDPSPSGERVYVSLRGSLPLSGDPHASTGSTPGVGVIEVRHGGRTGVLRSIARVANVDGTGVDRADVHALRVRRR